MRLYQSYQRKYWIYLYLSNIYVKTYKVSSSVFQCGDKQKDSNQYLSLKSTLQTADYENVPEGKAALDEKKKKVKKNRDYVNIQEQRNLALTKGRRSKREDHEEDQDESQTSSESSSDESDGDSVNYSTVVFKEASNAGQKQQ